MPAPALADVDQPRITPVRLPRRAAQPIFRAGHHHEMHVVRHQTVGPGLRATTLAGLDDQTAVLGVILLDKERLLATVPALSDVVRQSGDNTTRDSGQSAPLRRKVGMAVTYTVTETPLTFATLPQLLIDFDREIRRWRASHGDLDH